MFFWVARFAMFFLMRIPFRLKITGVENIPKHGGFIICANHLHAFDPIILAVSVHRKIRFMAKKELFKNPLIGAFFRSLGAFPVDRDAADMQSYRNALGALKKGGGLLLFSQGTRMKDIDAKSAKGGVAVFGIKSRAPVIPVGLSASYKPFSTVRLRFGEPVSLERYQGQRLKAELIDEIMSDIMEKVQCLASNENEG